MNGGFLLQDKCTKIKEDNKQNMCRQFITAGKLSNLQKRIREIYSEEIKIKLTGQIDEEEEKLKEEIEEELEEQKRYRKNHEALLTEEIPVIIFESGEKYLTRMKWGIKFDPENKSPLIFNSRDDTIVNKDYWRELFDKNRTIIPMFGFFEWQDIGKKKKLKTLITLKGGRLFFVPGLFWKNKDGIEEFTIVTTSPNKFMSEIHSRMPVILEDRNIFNWFTDSEEENLAKLKPSMREMEKEEQFENTLSNQGSLFD